MPNYRYQSSEYARRRNCARPSMTPAPCGQDTPAPVCCDDTAGYDPLRNMPLAMAYVPWQKWGSLLEPDKAFHCGTIFEELNKPFRGIGGCCK